MIRSLRTSKEPKEIKEGKSDQRTNIPIVTLERLRVDNIIRNLQGEIAEEPKDLERERKKWESWEQDRWLRRHLCRLRGHLYVLHRSQWEQRAVELTSAPLMIGEMLREAPKVSPRNLEKTSTQIVSEHNSNCSSADNLVEV